MPGDCVFLIIFVFMKPATIREFIAKIGSSLGELYSDAAEGKSVAEYLLASLLHTDRAGLYSIGGKIDDPQMLQSIQSAFNRLMENEPVQYVIGKTWFGGLEIKVAPDVLIPRPETEELAEWVISMHEKEQDQLEIIDVGTGSGCLALLLKSRMPGAKVSGIDISDAALLLASENAVFHGLEISWLKLDILEAVYCPDAGKKLIVVSNPPYVLDSERETMAERVRLYEPEIALFVPDSDPLRFYRRIAEIFQHDAAAMYFEINPMMDLQLCEMSKQFGFYSEIRNDFFGRNRMLRFIRLSVS